MNGISRRTSRRQGTASRCRRHTARRGAVLVVTMVALVIVMAILGGLLLGTLRARRQLVAERDRRQAELLLQSGLDRARYRLARENDYRGETWTLTTDAIVGAGDGEVVIQATPPSGDEPWQVSVSAEYPRGSALSVRRSRVYSIPSHPTRNEE